eukprot:gnl/TRDRNA2_/TRDRNA2_42425_c0_seq1.p1 gnl/TRDRNA2_/TRDRNA2_42425_c0~~gnl/TRDRNA2_/TRDRNA2_42425_c0_seq1.p1  ORF type:complete len:486 (-),score=98.42 gnl/TRDRNA2_/TRDRNA2_42425_c0_seq1:214-1671(-)
MRSMVAVILLGYVMCNYVKVSAMETVSTHDSEEKTVDEMLDILLGRRFVASPTSSDLDGTTNGKSVALASGTNLATVPQSRVRAPLGGITSPSMSSSMSSRMLQQAPSTVLSVSQTRAAQPQGHGQVQAKAAVPEIKTVAAAATSAKGQPVVAVVGFTGGVGTALLAAMDRIGLKPFAKVSSKIMECEGEESQAVDFDALGKKVVAAAKEKGGVPVIADVTASAAVQEQYQGWLSQGITVVAANKGIFAGPEAKYQGLLSAAAAEPQARLLHETTVGAGLPVISTIKDLVTSSHDIVKVEGIMSGTLAFVLGEVAGGKKAFSAAVKEAKELGYTEPDPREDLNGMDVARKSVILARVSGLEGVELSSMNIESLVPESLKDCSVDEFMAGLPAFDEEFAARVAAVEAKGERLHYAGKVDMKAGKVTVGPLGCEASHPFNNAGPDNLVSITTNFYTRPLVVQGAGAGGDVTATGVLADIMRARNQPL